MKRDVANLARTLQRAPEPEAAAKLAAEVLAVAPRERLDAAAARHPERLTRILLALCGTAPFFASHLRRQPLWLCELLEDDLAQRRSGADRSARLERELARGDTAAAALRRLKYFELARITVRDSCESWLPLESSAETLAEVSSLADLLLARALRVAKTGLEAELGPARWPGPDGRDTPLRLCVLGLGKLGSEELNFSSDVDLVYVYDSPPEPVGPGPGGLAPAPYFARLARSFGALVADRSPDGFLYRVDLDLRPEGSQGPIAMPDEGLCRYFETVADTWEKTAYMKARPVAGDPKLGWRLIRRLRPLIYRSSTDYAAVAAIKSLKEQIESAHGGGGAFNVKLDGGGIRDIEFFAQAMQLLHGGRIPQLRERSTQRTLRGLVQVGLLSEQAERDLQHAYRFLRRLENRLQMQDERQTHRLPDDAPGIAHIARAMGYDADDGPGAFFAELDSQRSRVLAHFEALTSDRGSERVGAIFARGAPKLARFPASRCMLEDLAEHFAREIDDSPDPDRALQGLERFVAGVGSRRFYYELLMDRPELVPRLVALFAASRFLSDILARHPRLIEPLFDDPDRLLLTSDELRADLQQLLEAASDGAQEDFEAQLAGLRLFRHRQILNVGLLDVAGKLSRAQVGAALTDIAVACIAGALRAARHWLEARADWPEVLDPARFCVVGMGKLGSAELGYGSDLDLIFLYDAVPEPAIPQAQSAFARLAQRLISILRTPTSEGICYEIDARMRPSGSQGALVTSLPSLRRYHEQGGQPWERQALLRARPVGGDAALGTAFETLRRDILRRPVEPDLARQIHRIRERMERELARETPRRHDFKTGRGGVLDVESVVQYLCLRHGRQHPELLEARPLLAQLESLGQRGRITDSDRLILSEGWEFLRRLASRLRIVEDRSISDLDEERGDLDGLARRLGYPASGRESAARRALLRDYAHHTEAIRRVYEGVLGVARIA